MLIKWNPILPQNLIYCGHQISPKYGFRCCVDKKHFRNLSHWSLHHIICNVSQKCVDVNKQRPNSKLEQGCADLCKQYPKWVIFKYKSWTAYIIIRLHCTKDRLHRYASGNDCYVLYNSILGLVIEPMVLRRSPQRGPGGGYFPNCRYFLQKIDRLSSKMNKVQGTNNNV